MTTNSPTEQDSEDFRSEGLSPDVVFTLLSHPKRRAVVRLLLNQDRALTLRDLRNEIVEREEGIEITEADESQTRQTLVSLHHAHIPKLTEAGVVTYDKDRQIVEPTEKIGQLESFLSCVDNIPTD
ncbi:helix-turn-helix domain-containing protein [Haloterrigena gelatinilytica]|uniref:helix-turn-helix domain-containing protein n=1 Tax=Haloterrigena gelatinilytica TaxID=2741724 RepID=UPI001C2E5573|nr:helix-turn-helix domain-containing protein [Haloterrigena gelatinilytica]